MVGVRIQEVTKEIAKVENLKNQRSFSCKRWSSPAEKALKLEKTLEFDGKKINTMKKLKSCSILILKFGEKKINLKKITFRKKKHQKNLKKQNKNR